MRQVHLRELEVSSMCGSNTICSFPKNRAHAKKICCIRKKALTWLSSNGESVFPSSVRLKAFSSSSASESAFFEDRFKPKGPLAAADVVRYSQSHNFSDFLSSSAKSLSDPN